METITPILNLKKFVRLLGKHAPLKKKKIRSNHSPQMTKLLVKTIIKTAKAKLKYFKTKTQKDYASLKKERNFYSKLYKEERIKDYENFNMKNVIDNTEF